MELVHGDDPERCYGEGGGRGGSCLGTHVRIKDFKIKKTNKTNKQTKKKNGVSHISPFSMFFPIFFHVLLLITHLTLILNENGVPKSRVHFSV